MFLEFWILTGFCNLVFIFLYVWFCVVIIVVESFWFFWLFLNVVDNSDNGDDEDDANDYGDHGNDDGEI